MATERDARTIAEIIRDSYSGLPARHVPYDMPLYHGDHVATMMEDAATRWAVLPEQGKLVGIAMWRVLTGMAHLHLLFVRGDYHGKGYGSLLLHYHQQSARREQENIRLFTLHCLRDSHWAMRFYRHQGYTLYEAGHEGRITDLYLWIDACRRHDNRWPLPPEKALFYKICK